MSRKVLVLFDLNERTSADYDFKPEFATEGFETERDVMAALRSLGHKPRALALFDDLSPLLEVVANDRPDLIFNMSEAFRLERRHEAHMAGLLELLGIPYTGSDPTALTLCKDKVLAKKVVQFHRLKSPKFVLSTRDRPRRRLRNMRFPVFVKPAATEGSEGIAQAALAEDEKSALDRIAFIHASLDNDALVEEFIAGREIYAGVLGNDRVRSLPLVELFVGNAPIDAAGAPEGAPRFFTYKAKWDEGYRKKWNIETGPAKDLPEPVERRVLETARKVYRALRVRGYGRVDMRLTPAGEIFIIEVNPNPGLARSDEFAKAAALMGLPYDALISRIVQLADR